MVPGLVPRHESSDRGGVGFGNDLVDLFVAGDVVVVVIAMDVPQLLLGVVVHVYGSPLHDNAHPQLALSL